MKVVHGVWNDDPETWCEEPRAGKYIARTIEQITCPACRKSFEDFKADLVARRGAPVTSGRRSAGAAEVKVRLSAKEAEALDEVRGSASRAAFLTRAGLEKAQKLAEGK